MKIEIFRPTCNLDTVRDGRGGIFTWLPKEPIVEFNMVVIRPGKVRGLHYHEHFVEYMLIVSGQGVMVTKDDAEDKDCPEEILMLSKGMCTRTPVGVLHTVYAINELTGVAMLTKPWHESIPPIVQVEPLPHQKEDQ
jgi:mannose-6-phosphate isomerase-like protein (cupin superfamily)